MSFGNRSIFQTCTAFEYWQWKLIEGREHNRLLCNHILLEGVRCCLPTSCRSDTLVFHYTNSPISIVGAFFQMTKHTFPSSILPTSSKAMDYSTEEKTVWLRFFSYKSRYRPARILLLMLTEGVYWPIYSKRLVFHNIRLFVPWEPIPSGRIWWNSNSTFSNKDYTLYGNGTSTCKILTGFLYKGSSRPIEADLSLFSADGSER